MDNESKEEFPIAICSVCGNQMEIEEWMPGDLLGCKITSADGTIYQGLIPHMNRSHPCACGKLWSSTDNIVPIGNILVWQHWEI